MTRPPILERLRGVQKAGASWLAFCPAHADREKRSLSVKVGTDGRTLLHCFVGCTTERVCSAVNMTLADLAAPSGNGRHPERRIVATYDFRDESGAVLYQEVKFEPKDFRLRRPDGAGGWTWSLEGVRRVVYRLDELPEHRTVFLVEGPKDADRLWSIRVPATTTVGGAKGWRREYAQQLKDAAIDRGGPSGQ
jgi:putative DNA primase/helicase